MNFSQWAAKWAHLAPAGMLDDLAQALADRPTPTSEARSGGEAAVIARVRLEASQRGIMLWRNNNGAGYMKDGSFIRWGLANDSAAVSAICKSSDLIGISRVGQFIARECKAPGWKFTGTPREVAQRTFINIINSHGGDAAFVTSEGSFTP